MEKKITWGLANVTLNTYLRLKGDPLFYPYYFLKEQRKKKEQEVIEKMGFSDYLFCYLEEEELVFLQEVFSKNISMIEKGIEKDIEKAKTGQLLPLLPDKNSYGMSFKELWESGYICAGRKENRVRSSGTKLTKDKIESLKGLEIRALPSMVVVFGDKTILKFKTTVNVEKILISRKGVSL